MFRNPNQPADAGVPSLAAFNRQLHDRFHQRQAAEEYKRERYGTARTFANGAELPKCPCRTCQPQRRGRRG